MSETRRISEFLPEVLQTDVLKKFFAATADNMFQPDRVEYVNAYVGQLLSTYNANLDARVPESTPDRLNYQVEPGMVSRNTQNNQITHVLAYDDLINKLRWQGALVNDHNRLFTGEYYSYGLPVDMDKLINYTQYVWMATGPQLIQLMSETNCAQIQTGSTYTYEGHIKFAISGVQEDNATVVFTSGLRVQFTQDINVQIRSQVYVVEGVGTRIRLVPEFTQPNLAWDSPPAWDSTTWDSAGLNETPAYVTIARGSPNGNPWSQTNRWFHKQVLVISKTDQSYSTIITAQRPILEFDHSIPLWNFGTQFLTNVNLVDTKRTNLDSVIGQTNVLVDNVRLDDGQIVLFTNLTDTNLNNRLYQVSGVRVDGKVTLSLITDITSESGLCAPGSVIFILQGNKPNDTGLNEPYYENVSTNWYFTGTKWVRGQSRQLLPNWLPDSQEYVATINQAPLFELFDSVGTNLADPVSYPNSNFAGSSLLSYRQNTALPVDPVLGFSPDVDSASARNYVFDVTCTQIQVTYYQNTDLVVVPGYYYWQQTFSDQTQYVNNWFLSDQLTKQYVINEYVVTNNETIFAIDQMPALTQTGTPNIIVQVGGTLLNETQYTVLNNTIQLKEKPAAQTVIKVGTWAGVHNQVRDGYFEIPVNLQANPDNQVVTQFMLADMLPHGQSVIRNQTGFTGTASGANNWRDSPKQLGRGTVILQHRASMLKLMALNGIDQSQSFEGSQSVTDPMVAMQWSQTEYLRFYNKFINALWNVYNNQALTGSDNPQLWLDRALRQINLGKTRASAWVNSGFDLSLGAYCSQQSVNPTWVPASATRLGAWSAYVPTVFYDLSQPGSPLTLRCHNGALCVLSDYNNEPMGQILNTQGVTTNVSELTHPVAKAWLLFEQLQYGSLPVKYSMEDHVPDLDVRTQLSGKFRVTSYTRSDVTTLQAPAWNRWLTMNQVDALRNTTFDISDPFSWNYGSSRDQDQQSLPGSWRGIYFYYYDTDQPHASPWRMLGFSQKPTWWDSEYGTAPYTRGNLKLWQDLEAGVIRQGDRAGTHVDWARPGLSKYVPVNDAGQLLAPFDAGIITQLPSQSQAAADWKFGDRSPMENVWLTSVDADQLWSQWAYLMRPAAFVEYLWDGVRQIELFEDQTYSQRVLSNTLTRTPVISCVMHRENPNLIPSLNSTETYHGSCGIQHWISEKLVSDSRSVTTYLGNLIRGAGVNLIHKMGGFTDGQNIRTLVDSFGLSNTDNLLLPQEDVICQLLRSASIKEYVYTGVLVEFLGRNQGWRVIGYDARDPYFEIIPSRITGAKQTVVVENQQVTEYKQGLNKTDIVPYGTVFQTRQQVYDFLISLGRAQEAAGWQFDEYDSTASRPRNWSLSAREFLYWSQGPWAAGTYMTLSPAATLCKFKTDFGIIQHIGGLVQGTHSVLDRLGNPISLANLDFLRIEDDISIKVLNDQGIYGIRLYTTSLEHALIFNNKTVFGDLVYDPVLNQRQARFKLFGYRTLDWKGRMQAPGYLVTQSVSQLGNNLVVNNRIIPNLEKTVDDLRKIFEIDLSIPFDQNKQTSSISQALPRNLQLLAQHQVAYQPRTYLTNLLLDNSAEFQFYQGMIHQKGTSVSIDALLRNTQVVQPEQEFYYFEEWAFRAGQYGYDQDLNNLDVILPQDQVTSNPQLVALLSNEDSDPLSDNQVTIVKNDVRIVNSYGDLSEFKLRTSYGSLKSDLPTAGPVIREDVNYTAVDKAELKSLYARIRSQVLADPTVSMIKPGQRVWQYIDPKRGWNVYKLCACAWSVLSTQPNARDNTQTIVTSTKDHGLKEGDMVVIYGVVNAGVNINDTFEVITVWDNTTFVIGMSTTGTGSGGTVWQYFSMRFPTLIARNQSTPPQGYQSGDLTWIDGDATTPWEIYISSGRNWFEYRTENYKTDLSYIQESRLYDLTSLQTLQIVALWDPVKNRIPGNIDAEITYKTAYDPAQYTVDPTFTYGVNAPQAWGEAQVGQVWWDLSTTRYLDYETGSDNQRRQNWGRIAPGTSIDVYEWVRSPVPPASWQNLVRSGADLTSIGSPGIASGEIKQANPPYVSRLQQTATGQLQTIYYFWTQNGTTVPATANRQISTSVIATSLAAPENLGIVWWAPISDKQTLIGNVGPYLNGTQTVWQTKWFNKYDVETVHREFDLIAQNDPRSSPPDWLWNKLGASLYEYDAYGNPLPDPTLRQLQSQGVLIRPRQGTFVDQVQSRRTVVQLVNQFLGASTQPPLSDPGRQSWLPYFQSEEPEPASTNIHDAVIVATTPYEETDGTSGRLNAYLQLDNDTGVSQLLSAQPGSLVLDGVVLRPGQTILIKNQNELTNALSPVIPAHDPSAENGIYMVVDAGVVIVNNNIPLLIEQDKDPVIITPGPLIVDSREITVNEKIYLMSQSIKSEIGVYILLSQGNSTAGPTIRKLYSQDQVIASDTLLSWCVQRVSDLSTPGQIWTNLQVSVTHGVTQAGTTWNQTNPSVQLLDMDQIVWQQGVAQPLWVSRVDNMAALYDLDYTLPFGSRVLVGADVTNMNKWTIWTWQNVGASQAEWQLYQSQTYRTQNTWDITDWYYSGYNSSSLWDYEFETLADRDAFLAFVTGDVVKVLNTGNNTWALYDCVQPASKTWRLVGKQSGTLTLKDNLWNYAANNLGFGAQGFGVEILGAEYDTRREFEQIWKGLWVNALGTQGLLKIDSSVNEPNQLMFALVNQVFAEQRFVDWAFKTSFINLRGFAEVLAPTELYTENNINSLIAYVNEIKPYHVKVRSFVDWRKASETYTGVYSDFDKPPFADVNQGVRILHEQVPADAVILQTDARYTAWYQNHVLNPQLVRQMRTRMIYDRVACAPEVYYSPGYSPSTQVDITCNSLSAWLGIILNNNIPVGTLIQVQAPGYTLMTRNQLQSSGLANWDFITWGLEYEGEIANTIYDITQVLNIINKPVGVGYTVRVYVDQVQTWVWYQKVSNTNTMQDWKTVAWQAPTGAAQRISDSYMPTGDMPSAQAPGLISGCESKLTSLSGKQFLTSDAWDANAWDDVKGWDYTNQQDTDSDMNVNSGQNLKYQLFVGNNTETQFMLRQPPQQPTELQVWVDGRKVFTPQDWIIRNQISQVLVSNKGLGYSMNDILIAQGGQYVSQAKFRVTGVTTLGAITSISLEEPGVYLVAPVMGVLPVMGGTGIQASVTVRWSGDQIKFTVAPGHPVQPRPNVWVIEKGETFNPALATLLDTTIDGAGLNRPHLEGGHPEELVMVWPRTNLIYDVYTAGTGGQGIMHNQVFDSDGVRTHFALPAPITEDQQLWVFVNGELKTHGVTADYVINYQYPQVVFVNAPAVGKVNIQQLGWGGASKGVGTVAVANPGSGYQLFDLITLTGSIPTGELAQAAVTAVKAVAISIVQGGQNYAVGDKLLYKYGTGTQTLILQVTQIKNQAGLRGVIDQLEIVQAGYYTNLSVGIDDWFTAGLGMQAELVPVWGAAQVFMSKRGIYAQDPQTLTQMSVIAAGGGVSEGVNIQLNMTPAHIQQQVTLHGDGATSGIQLNNPANVGTVWVTYNGATTISWGVDSGDPRNIVLDFIPQVGDVVIASVFNSSLFSLKRVQTLVLDLPNLSYDLEYAPLYSAPQGLNSQVFVNGILIRGPEYRRFQGDGVQTEWNLNTTVSDPDTMVKVWINGVLQANFSYTFPTTSQIKFDVEYTPAALSDILIQIVDTVTPNLDYVITDEQAVFQSGVLSGADQVQVITFQEDSSVKWAQDRFTGTSPAMYVLSRMPSDFGSVQVYVNGIKQSEVWDYTFVQVADQVQVKFHTVHTSGTKVLMYYVVSEPVKPHVAFRMFENIYGDTKFYRLSDSRYTKLTDTITWQEDHIWVQDGAKLPVATVQNPGVIWVNSERIEYTVAEPDANEVFPNRVKLSGLRRGSMGTSTGIFSDLVTEFHNGDGETTLYVTEFASPIVKVNGLEQVKGVHYNIIKDPPSVVPGTYIKFIKTDLVNYTPPPGDRNVCMINIINSISSGSVSHKSGTWVQDASMNQEIPAGYIWPYGDQGIQYSAEPQTAFLIAEPGTRHR
jgi:hypothetical protein